MTATLRYLMEDQQNYFIENDSFYPNGFGSITVNRGRGNDIPELAYTFPADFDRNGNN